MTPSITRPSAPLDLDLNGEFRPAHDLREWAFSTFIDDGAALQNPQHAHLKGASIGFLWTNVANARHMRAIAATCELGKPQAQGKWAKARAEQQVRGWFGDIPDFVITVSTDAWLNSDDVSACALIEHELSHAGQERDEFDMPKFRKNGAPCFALLGHDVEEFVGVVRRYGVDAGAGATRELVAAANALPEIGLARVQMACGTCRLKAA